MNTFKCYSTEMRTVAHTISKTGYLALFGTQTEFRIALNTHDLLNFCNRLLNLKLEEFSKFPELQYLYV